MVVPANNLYSIVNNGASGPIFLSNLFGISGPRFVACLMFTLWSSLSQAEADPAQSTPDCVVLLHGLWRDERAMSFIDKQLQQSGYQTINVSYPSMQESLPVLADRYVSAAVQACRNLSSPRIHFVTHSMGGILARLYLQTHSLPQGSRMVMLSPPNHGSEWVDWMRDSVWMSALLGPAGGQLATDSSLLRELKPVALEVGVITGSGGRGWFGMPVPNDNAVTVASARLPEMSDFLVVPLNHVSIRRSEPVVQQMLSFLRQGRFLVEPSAPPGDTVALQASAVSVVAD